MPVCSVEQIDAGVDHICSLKGDGSAWCWGSNVQGRLGMGTEGGLQPSPQPVLDGGLPLTGAEEIRAGGEMTCVRRGDGTVVCWGDPTGRATSRPVMLVTGATMGDVTQVETAARSGCARRSDGTAWCWDSSYVASDVLRQGARPLSDVVSLSMGSSDGTSVHTCAVVEDATVWCWGDNRFAQLGNCCSGQSEAIAIANLSEVEAVGCGNSYCCGLKTSNEVVCWGTNGYGQIGPNNLGGMVGPTVAAELADAAELAPGAHHVCVMTSTGELHCWGDNSSGQLADGTQNQSAVPVRALGTDGAPLTDVIAVTAGDGFTCARAESEHALICWGRNGQGQLSQWPAVLSSSLSPILHDVCGAETCEPPGVTAIDAGTQHTCAAIEDGGVRCWGLTDSAQLGNNMGVGFTPRSMTALALDGQPLFGIVAISASNHNCARSGENQVWCWGRNDWGQLSDSSGATAARQVLLDGDTLDRVNDVSVGGGHSCAVRSDGVVYCWGRNDQYELGRGDDEGRQVAAVDGPGGELWDLTQVTAGHQHTCGLRTDGAVWCWGGDSFGSFDQPRRILSPFDEQPLSSVEEVRAGASFSCARLADSTVWCWGDNSFGQLGDGKVGSASVTAVQVMDGGAPLDDVVGVSAGESHVCALQSDFTVRCWGRNDRGQLGDGTDLDSATPVQVVTADAAPLADVDQIALGGQHSCAQETDDTLWCWGDNAHGQLGDYPARLDRSLNAIPVQLTCR